MFDITTNHIEKETTLEYSTVILEYCKKWIAKEMTLLPTDVECEKSAIFNLLSFSLLSLNSQEGLNFLDQLSTSSMRQYTPLRLKELSFQLKMLVGIQVIDQFILPGFIEGLRNEANLSIDESNRLLNIYPHVWVIPYIQMASMFINQK